MTHRGRSPAQMTRMRELQRARHAAFRAERAMMARKGWVYWWAGTCYVPAGRR